jgi:arylsulfate sulfotransferase
MNALVTEGPTLTLDPNGITPLAAALALATNAPTSVSIEVLGELPVSHAFQELAESHDLAVLGLYPDTENQVVVTVVDPLVGFARDTLTVTTDPLPEAFPNVTIVQADILRMEPGWTLSELSLAGGGVWDTKPILFDSNGDIRWTIDLEFLGGLVFPVKRSSDGTLLVARGHDIYELDMLGTELNKWVVPGFWQHHELVEMPNGNLLLAVDPGDRETVEDHIVEMDRTTGAVVREWDMREVLDVTRRTFMDNEEDWFHMNAIYYVADEDALIVSGRNQAVVKVTGENELVWILAPHEGWGKAGIDGDGFETSDFLLRAVDATGTPYPDAVQRGETDGSAFSWAWGQHAPMLLPDGDLFVFDNGLTRSFSAATPTFSRGVQYEIDEAQMTVREVWQYGAERGDEFYSSIISDVDHLDQTGNRLIMPGIVNAPVARALVTEVTYPSKDIVFEASIEFKNLNGTGQGWGEMDIVYRSERIPLYTEE